MLANKKRLYQDVRFLTSISPSRNYKNVESLTKAANYIKMEFRKTGLPTFVQQWEAKGTVYENIIASFKPEKSSRFIIGAHYDVYGNQPGADDNASGVAGLLEIARLLQESNHPVNYGVDFVSFCLEEPPFFKRKEMGSYIHAKSVYDNNQHIIGMISIEMIGYYGESSNSSESASGINRLIVSGIRKYDDFNKKISQLLKENSDMNSLRLSYANKYPNNGPSDHRNYWKYGYPAAMVIGTSGKGNPHYHKKSDTIETLNFEVMAEAVNGLAHATFKFES